MYTDHKMLLVANEMFYLLPLKANSHCIHRCWQMATDAFVRFCLISVLRLSASAAMGQHLFSTTEHAESVFVRSRMSEKGHIGLRLSAKSELTWIFTAAAWFTLPCCLFEVYKNQSDPKWSVIAFIFYKHFVMTYCVLCRFQLRDPPLNSFVILPIWKMSLGRLHIDSDDQLKLLCLTARLV